MTRTFKTNLRCEGCISAIAPILNGAAGIDSWTADVASPDKLLTLEGSEVGRERVNELLGKAGYHVLDEVGPATPAAEAGTASPTTGPQEKTSYFPLALIVGYILGVVLLIEASRGSFA